MSLSFLSRPTPATNNASSYTFVGVGLGAADATRRIIVCACPSAIAAVQSVTIAGVSATQVEAATRTYPLVSSIWIADVPTGTSGDIVVTTASGVQRCWISVYRATNLASNTPYDTGIDNAASSGVVTVSVDVPAGGFAIGVASTGDGSAWSWTAGLSEDSDDRVESQTAHSSASADFASAVSGQAVTATCSTGSRACLAVASWAIVDDVEVDVTGVSSTSAVGTLTATGGAVAAITGNAATGAVGSLTVTGSAVAALTGVSATSAVGTPAVAAGAIVALTGVEATTAVGDVATRTVAQALPTGVEATGAAGDLTVTTGAIVALTGVAATGVAGTLAATGGAIAPVTGVQASGEAGDVSVAISIEAALTGVEATGAAGDVTAVGGAVVALTGVEASAAVGEVDVIGADGALANIVGVEATGQVGNILIIIRPASIWTDLFKDRNDLALNDNATGDHTSRNLITKPGISPSQITSDHPSRSGITRSGVSLSKNQQVFR